MGNSSTGLLGGTFNPIHKGHLALARFCMERLDLGAVWFVTAKSPPHKTGKRQAPAWDRHRMVELATEDHPGLCAVDSELRREGPSYTVFTLREVRRRSPETSLFFLVGADTITELSSWYRLEEILSLATIVTVTRPGYPERYEPGDSTGLSREETGKLNRFILSMPPRAESSTVIRERIAQGKPYGHMVPRKVAEYIDRHQLYKDLALPKS